MQCLPEQDWINSDFTVSIGKIKTLCFKKKKNRKTLEELLDFYPLTRRAWQKAQSENDAYQ